MKDKKNTQAQPEIDVKKTQHTGTPENENIGEATLVEPEIVDTLDTEDADIEDFANAEMNTNAQLQKELDDTKASLEKEKKEYLFLMAEFDNYRKRVVKEKAELIKNAGEKALAGILPVVDDFERALEAAAKTNDAEAILKGIELIYNKFIKYLADNGVKAMETNGQTFDPEVHEAIAMVPAANDEQKGHIIDTTQKGYTLNDKVLRHAKVVVAQ